MGDMEEIGRGLRKDATRGISYAELEQALAVMNRIKDNLQALDQSARESEEPAVDPGEGV